jgi:dTDP-4-dehydrorhamnose reductase
MKRILVIGSNGMAGHIVRRYLDISGKFIVGEIARSTVFGRFNYSLDVTDINELDKVLNDFKPEVIVNCIGVLNSDAEGSPTKAIMVNSFFPHHLALRAGAIGSRLIHISTDCVFSGLKGNYHDSDETDGIGFYAKSKALGEVDYGRHLTIRTSIVGPEIKNTGIGLLHWFLHYDGNELSGYTQAYWSGVTTFQLAVAIDRAIEEPINGLVHLTSGIKISKYELLTIFKDVFKKDLYIKPDKNYKVDKSLALSLHTNLLGAVPSYQEMVQRMKLWMDDNNDMYNYNY